MSNDLIPSQQEIQNIEKMAKYALDSKFFEKMGGMAGIFSIMMYAKELGLNPMTSLFGGMNNVQGKIEIAAVMMNAMIRRAGHRIDILESSNEKCTLKGTRKESGETAQITFTINDAKVAGIFKAGGGWEKYTSDMLFARAISRLARRLFPDVIGSMYVEGEISDSQEDKVETTTVNIEAEQVEDKPDITVERSAELISQFIGIENSQLLKEYISSCMSRTKNSLSETTNKWIEKKEKFIEYFNAWKDKQNLIVSKEVSLKN